MRFKQAKSSFVSLIVVIGLALLAYPVKGQTTTRGLEGAWWKNDLPENRQQIRASMVGGAQIVFRGSDMADQPSANSVQLSELNHFDGATF